jgi:hypothetical protein
LAVLQRDTFEERYSADSRFVVRLNEGRRVAVEVRREVQPDVFPLA